MARRAALVIVSGILITALPQNATAQDAAESAAILSGTGAGQAKAQRSLGTAVTGSINRAASAINTRPTARRGSSATRQSRSRGQQRQGYVVHGSADPLAGTDASTYRLGNGASIRVSGTLHTDKTTECVANCK